MFVFKVFNFYIYIYIFYKNAFLMFFYSCDQLFYLYEMKRLTLLIMARASALRNLG